MSDINIPNITPEENLNSERAIRREKLHLLKAAGQNPFEITKFLTDASAFQILNLYSDFEDKVVNLAGRIMSKRIMGKASFSHIEDGSGKIQLYIKGDIVGLDVYEAYKKSDIGDIIGVKGEVFTTQHGEISVKVSECVMLAKSLNPLPEKFHGLTNTDLRYRMRYVDLIVNPEVKDAFVKRSKIISSIREFLNQKGFLEVETPILNSVPSGANARPFTTHHNTLDIGLYLRIAPELYLKRLLVGGFLKVYELGRVFRNEGMSVKHNPEFTIMELYQAYADFNDMMDITEELFKFCAKNALNTQVINFQGVEIDFNKAWRRVPMPTLVKECTGLDFYASDLKDIIENAKKVGVFIDKNASWGEALYKVFDEAVESKLIQPTFVTDYPIEVSPLAKKKKDDNRLTERFEFFINGWEMGNAFSELNDPEDQKERFEEQAKQRLKGDDEAQMTDHDFVNALEYGMPPAGGLGIGIDRMVMLFTDNPSIRDVLLFPTMKPKN
jgi:lysyl-tRNA synthetase class 2